MNWVKPPRIYTYSFWLSMPVITFAMMYIIYDERVWADWKVWIATWPVIYFIGYFSWYAHVQYDLFLRRKYPLLQQTGKRVLYKTAVNLWL